MAKFCPECGSKLEDNARFCENCGTPCEAVEAVSQPEPQPVPEPAPQPVPQPVIPPVTPPVSGFEPKPVSQPQPQPVTPQAAAPAPQPYGDPYQQPSYSANQYGADSSPAPKKSKTGLIIALASAAVVVIAAAVVVCFVWKPWENKNSNTSGSGDTTSSQSTEDPSGTDVTDAPTQSPFTVAPTDVPTQAPTDAPTDTPTAAQDGAYVLTSFDRSEISQKLEAIVEYGYSAKNADINNYIRMTFDYNFCLDSSYREDLYYDNVDTFYDDVDDFSEDYGSDYVIETSVTDIEVYEGEDLESELDYYRDDFDVSGVEAIVMVHGTAEVSGSKDSDTKTVTWEFFKVNGKWYPGF